MNVGDRITINDPRATYHGQPGIIIGLDSTSPFPYYIRMAPDTDGETMFWFSADELTATSELAHDFDRGFGIGGLSRHSADEGLDRLIANGTLHYREPSGIKMPNGQLWQPCFCGIEPVCLDCERCETHCTC